MPRKLRICDYSTTSGSGILRLISISKVRTGIPCVIGNSTTFDRAFANFDLRGPAALGTNVLAKVFSGRGITTNGCILRDRGNGIKFCDMVSKRRSAVNPGHTCVTLSKTSTAVRVFCLRNSNVARIGSVTSIKRSRIIAICGLGKIRMHHNIGVDRTTRNLPGNVCMASARGGVIIR